MEDILIGFVYGIPVGGCIYALAWRMLRSGSSEADRLRERVETLIQERDEARRECCRRHAYNSLPEEDFAKWLQWDCFDKKARNQ